MGLQMAALPAASFVGFLTLLLLSWNFDIVDASQIVTILLILSIKTVRNDVGSRIVGGREVDLGEFPFVAQIFVSRTKKHRCGGSILSPSTVITAAHCFDLAPNVFGNHNAYRVLAGDVRTVNSEPPKSRQIKKLKTVIVHENYDAMEHLNDICLITIRGNMEISSNLASIRTSHFRPTVGTICSVLGWGATSRSSGSLSGSSSTTTVLRMAVIKVEESRVCDRKFARFHRMQFICAGDMSGNNDSCKGDSGGPLIFDNHLAGIVSFGNPICGSPGYPASYTDVAYYENWIKKTEGRNTGHASFDEIIAVEAVIFAVIAAM